MRTFLGKETKGEGRLDIEMEVGVRDTRWAPTRPSATPALHRAPAKVTLLGSLPVAPSEETRGGNTPVPQISASPFQPRSVQCSPLAPQSSQSCGFTPSSHQLIWLITDGISAPRDRARSLTHIPQDSK